VRQAVLCHQIFGAAGNTESGFSDSDVLVRGVSCAARHERRETLVKEDSMENGTAMTTPTSEIVESYRAISVAAAERHAALLKEAQELEMAFPSLRRMALVGTNGAVDRRKAWTPERRAAHAERMRQQWARREQPVSLAS
jgi:hypothetical protein